MDKAWFIIRFMLVSLPSLILLAWFSIYAFLALFIPRPIVVGLATLTGFVLADIIYNAICGTILFWEWPREWLFTTRLKRHKEQGEWAVQLFEIVLNRLEPGHV